MNLNLKSTNCLSMVFQNNDGIAFFWRKCSVRSMEPWCLMGMTDQIARIYKLLKMVNAIWISCLKLMFHRSCYWISINNSSWKIFLWAPFKWALCKPFQWVEVISPTLSLLSILSHLKSTMKPYHWKAQRVLFIFIFIFSPFCENVQFYIL